MSLSLPPPPPPPAAAAAAPASLAVAKRALAWALAAPVPPSFVSMYGQVAVFLHEPSSSSSGTSSAPTSQLRTLRKSWNSAFAGSLILYVTKPPVRSRPMNASVSSPITPVVTHSGSGPLASERSSMLGGASSELNGHSTSHRATFAALSQPLQRPFATLNVTSSNLLPESKTWTSGSVLDLYSKIVNDRPPIDTMPPSEPVPADPFVVVRGAFAQSHRFGPE